jgi:hypothetical protein
MATASPYSQNDYAVVNTRPYQLPVNDILKTFVAKNQYWEQGAQRIKSVYDNALDLTLTKNANKKIKDDYLMNAQEEIKKLSASDLSDPAVQRAGVSLFTPLFKDEGVMSDDQATKYINKTNAEALSFRNKDGGKEYSATNHAYALDGAAEFQDPLNPDRFAGKKYLAQAKNYIPYYDTTSELLNIKSKCGSISSSSASIDEGYIKTVSKTGTSDEQLRGCVESALSDKARKQFSINGYVQYGKNYQALGGDYYSNLNNIEAQYRKQIATHSGYVSATGKDALSPEMKKYHEDEIGNLSAKLANVQQSKGKIARGDYSELTANYETIAGSIFTTRAVNNFANAFQTQKTDTKLQADAWQTALLTQRGLNVRQQNDFAHDIQMEGIKHDNAMELMYGKALTKMGGIANPFGGGPEQFFPAATQTQSTTYDNLLKTIDSTKLERDRTLKDLFISMKNSNLGDTWMNGKDVTYLNSATGLSEFYDYIKSYNQGLIDKKDLKKVGELKPFFDKLSGYTQAIEINNSIKDAVESRISPEEKAKFDKKMSDFNSSLQATTAGGNYLSPDKQKAILSGDDSDFGFVVDVPQGYRGSATSDVVKLIDKRTGARIQIPENLANKIQEFRRLSSESMSSYKNRANEVLGKDYATQVAVFNIDKTREANQWKDMLAGRIAPSDKDFAKQIGVLNSPLSGSATFRIPKSFGTGNDKTDIGEDNIVKTLAAEFGNSTVQGVKESPDGNFYDVTIKDKDFDFSSNYSQNREAILTLANIKAADLNTGRNRETNSQVTQAMSPTDGHAYSLNVDRNRNAYIYDKTENKAIQTNLPIERAIQIYNAIIKGDIK